MQVAVTGIRTLAVALLLAELALPSLVWADAADVPPPLPNPKPTESRCTQDQYYIGATGADGLVRVGPLCKDVIIDRIKNGSVDSKTPLWKKGMPDWSTVCIVDEFKPTCEEVVVSKGLAQNLIGYWRIDNDDSAYQFGQSGQGYYYREGGHDIAHDAAPITWKVLYTDKIVFRISICDPFNCFDSGKVMFVDGDKLHFIETVFYLTRVRDN